MILTFKALHLVSMVGWFAGLFYIFRILVYYIENIKSKQITDILKKMSHRLYFFVATPFMLLTLIFGLVLLLQNSFYMQMGWFHLKLTLLFLLICYHLFIGYTFSRFIKGEIFLNTWQCRCLSRIPEALLALIIFIAVFRPSF